MRGASAADTERLATLLWAVKEAILKTGASTAGNVWGMGAIDLAVATPAEQVARSLAAGEAASLKPLDVAVAGRGGPAARVAYGTRGGLPLAVMVLAPDDMTHT